ncbi:MAG: WecB/TagA/CpsF family glycosyltransferase [Patescibacteria group bacterium]
MERKYGEILGIKISITNKDEVLDFIKSKLESKEKFYVVTPNPENLLIATKDWLLKKAIRRAAFSIPDGIGLKFAYKFLHNNDLEIIKGRELFLEILKIIDQKKGRVYLFGGENGEQEDAIKNLQTKFPNVAFQTNYKFPQFNKNGRPVSVIDRTMHKSILGSIKLFEPDMIFVALNTPKQEKWIFKNIYRLPGVTGAMTVGGTFNYMAGNMKLPPKWMEKIGLEWIYRLIQEPWRFKRIINAVIVFPWKVFMWKLTK